MSSPNAAPPTLGYGSFFGRFVQQREVPGFSIAAITPLLPPSEVRTHTHESAHFVLVMAGLYISQARHAPAIAQSPLLIYNPPGTTHRDRFYTLDGCFLTVSVSSERLRSVTENTPLITEAVVLRGSHSTMLARRLAGEMMRWQSASPLMAEGMGLELLAEVAATKERADQLAPAWLKQAGDMLRQQCGDNVSIADVATAVDVHPVHLARSFRRFFRCSPGEYLRNCRLEKAAELLVETRSPLATIALESGFADQSHFCKLFSRSFGRSPREYRRQFGVRVFDSDQ